jgi:hypothetical protein
MPPRWPPLPEIRCFAERCHAPADHELERQLGTPAPGRAGAAGARVRSRSGLEVRTITKPVAGSVHLYKDAVEQLFGWSVDVTTGVVTFSTSPAAGVQLTADFEFDVPVRFDTDHMAVTIESYRLHAWQQIPIVELRT